MSKHTQERWEVDLDEEASHPAVRNICIYEKVPCLPNGRLLVASHVVGPDSAALIAAAPELLEALKAVQADLRGWVGCVARSHGHNSEQARNAERRLHALTAAIAKAEGRS